MSIIVPQQKQGGHDHDNGPQRSDDPILLCRVLWTSRRSRRSRVLDSPARPGRRRLQRDRRRLRPIPGSAVPLRRRAARPAHRRHLRDAVRPCTRWRRPALLAGRRRAGPGFAGRRGAGHPAGRPGQRSRPGHAAAGGGHPLHGADRGRRQGLPGLRRDRSRTRPCSTIRQTTTTASSTPTRSRSSPPSTAAPRHTTISSCCKRQKRTRGSAPVVMLRRA